MPDPQSPLAQGSIDLFNASLIIATLIVLGVGGLIGYMIFRFRARAGAEEPVRNFGNRKLEIGWTAAPALLLTVIAVFLIPTLGNQDVSPSKTGPEPQPDLIVTGHQWWWEIRYPTANMVTANEIHMPIGKRLLVRLEAGDVIHDLWIPQLGPKMDNVPGQTNWMYLQADKPGTYQGACAEYCGGPHAWMLIRAVAQSQADFDAWVRSQTAPPAAATGSAARGAQLFAQRTCISCHAITGVGQAQAGPNLTHFASRSILGAGVLANTPDVAAQNIAAWLRNPQAVKPGNHMPNLRLNESEISDLTAYMESLK